jgi:hypothetical protein
MLAITRRGPVLPTAFTNNMDSFFFFLFRLHFTFPHMDRNRKRVTQKVAWTKETLEMTIKAVRSGGKT